MAEFNDTIDRHIANLDAARTARLAHHIGREGDSQQMTESRISEQGRRFVVLEPPSSEDPAWSFAPPHRTSHWDSITGHNRDPPSRVHVKMISSYRRAYPEAENRPDTPRAPQWGGDRDALTATA